MSGIRQRIVPSGDLPGISNLAHEFMEQRDSLLQGKTKHETASIRTVDKRAIVIILSLILDLLGFTMILPLFPAILDHYRRHDGAEGLYAWCSGKIKYFQVLIGAPEKSNTVLFGGVLGSLFSMLQFVASPIVGALSDVYGRKPVMIVSLVGIAVSYLLWGLSRTFSLFVISRFVGGISKGNVSLALAILADVLSPWQRGWGMAHVGIAFSVGFVIGPIIGASFASLPKEGAFWFKYPAAFALVLALANIFFVFFWMKESLPKERRSASVASTTREAFSYINVIDLFNFKAVSNLPSNDKRELCRLGLIYFLYMFMYSGMEFTVTFLTHYQFNFTSMEQGYMFFGVGLLMAIVQGWYVRKVPANEMTSRAILGLSLIVPAFFFIGISPSFTPGLYVGLCLYAVSTSLVIPCINTIVSDFGSFDQKGTVMGIFRALGALARALGPVVFATTYWIIGPMVTYMLGSTLLVIPWLLMKSLYDPGFLCTIMHME